MIRLTRLSDLFQEKVWVGAGSAGLFSCGILNTQDTTVRTQADSEMSGFKNKEGKGHP